MRESENDARVRLIVCAIFVIVPNFFYFKALDVFNFPKQAVFLILAAGLIPFVWHSYKYLQISILERLIWFILFLGPVVSLLGHLPLLSTSIWGVFSRANGFLTTFTCLLFALVVRMYTTKKLLISVSRSVIILAVVQASYSSMQALGLDPIEWNNPYAPIISTLGNPNFASAILGFLGTWCFALGISSRQQFGNYSKVTRITSMSLFPVLVFLCFKTTSIQGLIGLSVGISSFLLLRYSLFTNSKIRIALGLSLTTFAAFSAALGIAGKGPLANLLFQDTLQIRIHYWKVGLEMMLKHPFMGVGPDSYGDYYMYYRDLSFVQQRGSQLFTNNAHSILVQWGATFGVIGFVGVLMISIGTILRYISFRRAIKATHNADTSLVDVVFSSWFCIAVILLVSIEQIGLSVLFWGLLGIIWGITERKAPLDSNLTSNSLEIKNKARLRNPKQKTKKTRADNSLILLMSTLAMILAAYPATRHMSNDLGLRSAISLAGAKQGIDDQSIIQRGETIYRYANRLADDRDYLSISVDNLFVNGPGEVAKKICEQVLLKNSRSVNALSCLSIFYENTGDVQRALEFRKKMLELDPLNYLTMYRIGKFYSLLGDKRQSILYLEKSLQIDSDDPVQLETKILLSEVKTNQ